MTHMFIEIILTYFHFIIKSGLKSKKAHNLSIIYKTSFDISLQFNKLILVVLFDSQKKNTFSK